MTLVCRYPQYLEISDIKVQLRGVVIGGRGQGVAAAGKLFFFFLDYIAAQNFSVVYSPNFSSCEVSASLAEF